MAARDEHGVHEGVLADDAKAVWIFIVTLEALLLLDPFETVQDRLLAGAVDPGQLGQPPQPRSRHVLPESPLQLPSGLQPSDVVVRLKVEDQIRAELEGGPALDASVALLPLGHILLAHQEDPVLDTFQAGQGRFLSAAVYLAPSPQFQHPAPEPSPDLVGGLQPQHVPLGLEVDGEAGVEEEEVLALGAIKRTMIRSRRGIEDGPSFRLEFEQKK